MSENILKAETLKALFISGAAQLDQKKAWVDELNVFPVPDGDTGTNMTMTIMSAVDAVMSLDDINMMSVCKAMSHGSLRGARGNSGVILSQLIRGFAKSIRDYNEVDCTRIAIAFRKAMETAYKAVMKPKEGTILTVARAMADKAVAIDKAGLSLDEFLLRVMEEGDVVLAQTQEMLPALKEAGVVDSGAQGLMLVIHGAYDALIGHPVELSSGKQEKTASVVKNAVRTEADIRFGYCTEFIINAVKELAEPEKEKLKKFLMGIGDSIVLVAEETMVKIHVHTNAPGEVLQKALTYGELVNIKIDNMREEHRNNLRLTNQEAKDILEPHGNTPQKVFKQLKKYGFITVASGDGFNELFNNLEADVVINGGQTMNPSTDDFLQAISNVDAENIFVFPNNKNIILAANQAKSMTHDKNIIVIPTVNVPQAITAMINFDPSVSAEENADVLNSSIEVVDCVQITYSIRDTQIDGKDIKQGDLMAVSEKKILAVGSDLSVLCDAALSTMVKDESEVITLYYGCDLSEEKAQEISGSIEEKYPDIAVELNYGGQAVYSMIIAVE